ncbi:BZ3500_MvSof-1268-A1-R1_Chr2-1g04498 [Microbotryum saponariae]|uniref:Elongation factor 1 alpha-like protein n=1 Tax=Microbotryum saponariae TaxID=289078 RepID=A0A2X0KGW1_9BASI|nr:BZ3500_MvSof-1268-A1-R1_Chr2-1g04498 [Microbotryum saponariae]SCZ91847.1 BZ3501_MvSof-1269-A2-R1_Chr2-1g04154 [Microbotryum saponariae]
MLHHHAWPAISQSRHRAVKQLDLAEQLDDDAIDSEGDDAYDMDDEQYAHMESGLSAVQNLLGPNTPISDKEIRDSLWDSYFDIDGTVAYLLDAQHKREAAKARAEGELTSAMAVETVEPPTSSLASLDISSSFISPTPSATATATATATKPPMSKLAAKMAARKQAAADSKGSTPTETSLAPVAAVEGPKLSKLQQKMLASRQARAAATAGAAGTSVTSADAPSVPPPVDTQSRVDVTVAPASGFVVPPALLASASAFAHVLVPPPPMSTADRLTRIEQTFARRGGAENVAEFGLSPDDKVLEARKGTAVAAGAPIRKRAKKAKAAAAAASSQPASARNSRPSTPAPSAQKKTGTRNLSPTKRPPPGPVSQLRADLEGLNLLPRNSSSASSTGATAGGSTPGTSSGAHTPSDIDNVEMSGPPPAIAMAKDKILAEVREREKDRKPVLSLVVVGHVDAGKSTLMGRVLHELGETSDRSVEQQQRNAAKIGKASFAYAWTFDAMEEERARGVTIDVAIDGFETNSKKFTLIDAPGHRDFIPNMISGAAQADTAVLVVDGSTGAFEKGMEGGGQTREHAVLVRSLGVQQLIVAVNKLDAVGWAQSRFEAIQEQLSPFLTQSGFQPSKVSFVPVGAMSGENLVERRNEILKAWYEGPTLVEQLDRLEVPPRALETPLRIPVSNVFKGQSATASGLAVSGRVESGIVQVGERLCALPGDESGVVRSLEVDGEHVSYAIAGVNVTVFLSNIDPLQLSVGSILCPPSEPIPVVSSFLAQIMVFDVKYPITAGYAVELFHHSRDIPATITTLEATLDKATGAVLKSKPRMLTKASSAKVRVQLRAPAGGSASSRRAVIPLEPFAVSKGMGRVLFRRGGETIAAGIVLEVGP